MLPSRGLSVSQQISQLPRVEWPSFFQYPVLLMTFYLFNRATFMSLQQLARNAVENKSGLYVYTLCNDVIRNAYLINRSTE